MQQYGVSLYAITISLPMEEHEARVQVHFTLDCPLANSLHTTVLQLYSACEEDPASPMLNTVKHRQFQC